MRMNRSRENLPVTISADWHSPIVSATIYLRVARCGSIIAEVMCSNEKNRYNYRACIFDIQRLQLALRCDGESIAASNRNEHS